MFKLATMATTFSTIELMLRLASYVEEQEETASHDPAHPSYSEAIERLTGCDKELVIGLARAHCLSPVKKSASFLDPELGEFAQALELCDQKYWALIRRIKSEAKRTSEADAVHIVEMLQLERFVPLVAAGKPLSNLAKRSFPIQAKVRIYLPLLCIYVRHVTGENHDGDIAAVLRPFHSVREKRLEEELIRKGRLNGDSDDRRRTRRFKGDIRGDAVRMADERYKKNYPQKYAALERAVREYHGSPQTARGQHPPHYELLLLAHQCLGNITAEQSTELSQGGSPEPLC